MILFFLLASAFGLLPENASGRYVDCLAILEEDVDRGRRAAQLWADEGGGAPARHCLALADVAAGYFKLAATRFESIAERKDAGDDLTRARLYAEAVEAWLRAERLAEARAALQHAEELAPGSGEIALIASRLYAASEEWSAVVDAVASAEQTGFANAAAYTARGRALLSLGNTEAAAQDVYRALSLDPTHLDALVLRGDVQRAGVAIPVFLAAPNRP